MMLLWFTLLAVGIIIFFWLLSKLLAAFDRQDRKIEAELNNRWYQEREKALEE